MNTIDEVHVHFVKKGREWPTLEDALLFIFTEVSEASELVLRDSRKSYKRNHEKEGYSDARFAEELGDIIYMVLVTGIVAGVNPVQAMLKKMESK